MDQRIQTYASRVSPMAVSNIADQRIRAANNDGWVVKSFQAYLRHRLFNGNLVDVHCITVLYEK